VPGLGVREAELADRHPLEMVPALPGFDQKDLALWMKDCERKAREPGSRAHVHQGANVGRRGGIQGGRVENEAPNHRLGRAMPRQVYPAGPLLDEGGELRERLQRRPWMHREGQRRQALGQQPDDLRLGGI